MCDIKSASLKEFGKSSKLKLLKTMIVVAMEAAVLGCCCRCFYSAAHESGAICMIHGSTTAHIVQAGLIAIHGEIA